MKDYHLDLWIKVYIAAVQATDMDTDSDTVNSRANKIACQALKDFDKLVGEVEKRDMGMKSGMKS